MADEAKFTKADLDAAITEAVGKVQDKLDELSNKNAGLLDDLKKAQREARAAKDIKPEDLQAAEERADRAEAELAKAQKAAKDATAAADKATKALADEQGFTQKLLIQDGLKSALIANGVKDEDYLDMAVAKFASSAKVIVEGDERKALLGDKPLSDAIKEWAATDAGKKIIAAPVNSGGGAGGSRTNTGSAKTMTRAAFDALPPSDQMSLSKEGITLTDA